MPDKSADWTREFRNRSMFIHVDMQRWAVVMPGKTQRETNDFIKMCIQAASGMRMNIAQPQM